MKKYIKKLFWVIAENLNLGEIKRQLKFKHDLLKDYYLKKYLYGNEKYADLKRLNRFEYSIYSQNGEDGIIEEIFQRIGTTNKFFVEFGVGNGVENNTLVLLSKDWRGCWIDSNSKHVADINKKLNFLISRNQLKIKNSFITAENIENLFEEMSVPIELDFLSIDIDGNDYWVWRAIKNYKPRAVVIEYNALWRANLKWVMKYNPQNEWNRTNYYGASLKSLELLGADKGYKLVGCDFNGVDAFFVRNDLVGDKFFTPFTAENHYEPEKPFLFKESTKNNFFGEFENI